MTAHGKHLFAAFGDRVVHVHLGLFGKYASGSGEPPPPRGALRMRWVGPDGWTDLRGPTACEVLSPDEVDAVLARLGPDPLAPRPNGERAYTRIARSRAPIAALLMDQTVVAGIGNVYRAELLFRHRVPPYLAGRELGPLRWELMWADLVTLMRAGVRTGRIITTRPEDRDPQERSGPQRRRALRLPPDRPAVPGLRDPGRHGAARRAQALLVPDLPSRGRNRQSCSSAPGG